MGAGLSAVGQHAQMQRQVKLKHQEEHDNALLQFYLQNPHLAADPEAQKNISKTWGKDIAQVVGEAGQLTRKAMGAMPQPPGMAPMAAPGPQTAPAAPNGGAAAQMMSVSAGTSPAPTPPPSQGASNAQLASHGMPGMDPNDPKAWQDYWNRLDAFERSSIGLDPAVTKMIQDHKAFAKDQIDRLGTLAEKQKEFTYRQGHDKSQAAEKTREFDIRQQELKETRDFNNWFKQQTLAGQKDRSSEQAQSRLRQGVTSQITNFQTRRTNLIAQLQTKLAAGTLNPTSTKPIINSFNQQVDKMAKAAKTAGVEFDPAEYYLSVDPGAKGYFGTSIGGTPASIAAGGATAPAAALGAPIATANMPDGTYTTKDGKHVTVKGGHVYASTSPGP